jgi:hypothetical protein
MMLFIGLVLGVTLFYTLLGIVKYYVDELGK